MAKQISITQSDVNEALQLVAGTDFSGKKRETKKYLPWLMNGDGHTALAFHPDVWGINADDYKPCSDSEPWSPSDNMGEYLGKVMVDNFRAGVMTAIGKVVDMRECGSAYGRRLEGTKYVMQLGHSYFRLDVLDTVCRCLLLGGLEIAELYENKNMNRVSFVGYKNGEKAVIVLMMAMNRYEDIKEGYPLVGRLTIMQIDSEAEVVPEIILESITHIQAFWEREEKDAKAFRKVYAVQLAMYNTYYVLANNEKEAEHIAMNVADADDFDDGFETESIEISDIGEAEDCGELYDKDGEVDIDEYIEEYCDCEEEDEE